MSSVPDEAPLCKKAIRPLHRERERHEVLQGEASSKGMTEPDMRGRKGGQTSTHQAETNSNFALNLVFV